MAGGQRRIETIFAYVALDPADNTEGVIGFRAPDGTWMPLVGADVERIKAIRPMAERIARESNTTVRLLRFTTRTELDIIKPGG